MTFEQVQSKYADKINDEGEFVGTEEEYAEYFRESFGAALKK